MQCLFCSRHKRSRKHRSTSFARVKTCFSQKVCFSKINISIFLTNPAESGVWRVLLFQLHAFAFLLSPPFSPHQKTHYDRAASLTHQVRAACDRYTDPCLCTQSNPKHTHTYTHAHRWDNRASEYSNSAMIFFDNASSVGLSMNKLFFPKGSAEWRSL